MYKELELEAKELLYSNITEKLEEMISEEKIAHYRESFFESINLEVVENDGNNRIIFCEKNHLGKRMHIRNIKLNIYRILKGVVELYIQSQILNESRICCIISVLKIIFEILMVDLSEEEMVIILAIYYEVSLGQQITDINLYDKVNIYAENYIGVKLTTSRIYESIGYLYENRIVDIYDGKFTIADHMIGADGDNR